MLNDKIRETRERLNESIITGKSYEEIYKLSVELDELIAKYYLHKESQDMKEEWNDIKYLIYKVKNIDFFVKKRYH